MKKASELRDMSVDELESALDDARKELFTLVNEAKKAKKIEKPDQLRKKRKGIARLMTVLTEKQTVQTN
jgi:ribosomal protein L29